MEKLIVVALFLFNVAFCLDTWSICGIKCDESAGGGCTDAKIAVDDLDTEGCYIDEQSTEFTIHCPPIGAPNISVVALSFSFLPSGTTTPHQIEGPFLINFPGHNPRFLVDGGDCPETHFLTGSCPLEEHHCVTTQFKGVSDNFPYALNTTVCLNSPCQDAPFTASYHFGSAPFLTFSFTTILMVLGLLTL